MYKYEKEKPSLFTEDGFKGLLRVRDNARKLFDQSGVFTLGSVIRGLTGNSFQMLAMVDFLVEIGELKLVTKGYMTQDDIYTLK